MSTARVDSRSRGERRERLSGLVSGLTFWVVGAVVTALLAVLLAWTLS
jgi:hypothetical protein